MKPKITFLMHALTIGIIALMVIQIQSTASAVSANASFSFPALTEPGSHNILQPDPAAPLYVSAQQSPIETPVPTETPLPEPTATETALPEPTVTETALPEPTATETALPEPTATETAIPEPTATETAIPEPTATETALPEPTATETALPEPTATETALPEPTATETALPEPTATETALPEPTATETAIPEPTATETALPEPTATETALPEPTATETAIPGPTVTSTLEPTATITPTDTPAPNPTIRLIPSVTRLGPGEIGEMAVEVANAANLYSVDVRLTYDPAVVQVIDANINEPGVQVALGSGVDPSNIVVVTNQAGDGAIHFAASFPAPPAGFSGAGSLINITWQANSQGQTPLVFEAVELTDSTGQPLPVTAENGRIGVGPVILRGQVLLQGSQDHSGITVSTGTQQVQTDAEGRFELQAEENYDLHISTPGFLTGRAQGTIPAEIGPDVVDFDLGTLILPGGDVNGDDRISIVDWAFIARNYGKRGTAADINRSGWVDIDDLTITGSNYGKSGPMTAWQ